MTPNTTPQARLGTIEEAGDKHILRYERRLDHPVERVWAALTEPEQLAGWLAAADELGLVEGGGVALRWLNTADQEEWKKYGVELGDQDPDTPAGTSTSITWPRPSPAVRSSGRPGRGTTWASGPGSGTATPRRWADGPGL